ncbi:SymE family type I addiction module toxin [Providencia manganoxydans]|uniref:SymE family type I addiction module toxin n=1 Tax=Providencia manganoxydans TaxID=2923283 RepID=UPI0032DBDBA5
MGYLPNRGKPNPSPQLIISGKWLKELGFEVGMHYTLTRQSGQLIIRLAEGKIRSLRRLSCLLGSLLLYISIYLE